MKEKTKEIVATGTGVGTGVGGVATLVHGASASTMTGTLATLGGGSMATGILVVAAIPILAGGLCWGGYKLYKKMKSSKKLNEVEK